MYFELGGTARRTHRHAFSSSLRDEEFLIGKFHAPALLNPGSPDGIPRAREVQQIVPSVDANEGWVTASSPSLNRDGQRLRGTEG